MAGGPQGSGVDSAANIFGRACGYGGLYVYGRREYHSNIKGAHSYFHLRIANHDLLANVNDVNMLAAFDAETVVRHVNELVPGAIVIVDRDQLNTVMMNVPPFPHEFKNQFREYMQKNRIGETLKDLLSFAEKKGVTTLAVPYMELLNQTGKNLGIEQISKITRMINVLTIGISFGILRYNPKLVERAINAVFSDRPKVVEMNLVAFNLAYSYALQAHVEKSGFELEATEVKEPRIFLSGNQAVAVGKILGGCRVQTYYPITPAADESEYLEAHEILNSKTSDVKSSIVVIQTEDEIAAINMASGAALTGARAATSTSGPGFSLMVEGLSWAGNNEVPVVITYYQRGAPSTGLPTRHGQDDLRFAVHAGHGEFPRMILCSGDMEECFYDAANAFNYAERYQIPVIHLIDKALANSSQTFPVFDSNKVKIDRGQVLDEKAAAEQKYERFKFTETGVSPRIYLGTKGALFWYTGDEHNPTGHISEEPANRTAMLEKRMRKLEQIDKEVSVNERVTFHGDENAKNLVVSWGSPKGALLEALSMLTSEGFSIGFMQVRITHPLPENYLTEVLSKAEKLIDVEMNYSGQLAGMIKEKTGIKMKYFILKYNGRPMTTTEVYEALKLALQDNAPERQVLTFGS